VTACLNKLKAGKETLGRCNARWSCDGTQTNRCRSARN